MNVPDEMHEHYEILGIDPTAKRANIILAYRRAKQTFAEDSLAIYALFSEQERQRMLARIEEAYAALSRASSTL